jgi:hypothetical protein
VLDPSSVPEAERDEHQQDGGSREGDDGGDAGDRADRGERVAVEQQAAKRVAHEERLAQTGQGLALLGRLLLIGHRDELAADLLVGPSAAGGVHVDEDVVVGVRLGLGPGVELAAGVLVHDLGVSRGQALEGSAGRHRDVLHHELVVYLVAHEGVGPRQQTTRYEKDRDEQKPGPGNELVECRAHDVRVSSVCGADPVPAPHRRR